MTGRGPERPRLLALLRWAACIGAVTAESLAHRERCSPASARGRLGAAAREGLLKRSAPLRGQPALYTITRAGLRTCALRGLQPACVRAGTAAHAVASATAAAWLESSYPDHRVIGEPELRREERGRGGPLASVSVGWDSGGHPLMHRPDLVLMPIAAATARPLAVEVELTVKAPRRLAAICAAWARSRDVEGVLYLIAPAVQGPLQRAIDAAQAGGRVAMVPLRALGGHRSAAEPTIARTIPTAS